MPAVADVVAPDGSAVRILLGLAGGTMAHFELASGATLIALRHRTVEEIWFVVSAWGRSGDGSDTTSRSSISTPGICVTIPVEHRVPVPM